jgi:hypothetical protein
MKIEKKIVSLSIIALVLGIIAILPIMIYAPSPVEPQHSLMSADEVFAAYGGNITLVAVPVIPTEDSSVLVYTLIPADEFFATYGGNTTIPYIPYSIPTPNPGD